MLEMRERDLIKANNDAALLRGLLIVSVPIVLMLILFLSSAPLRNASLRHVAIDVGITVLCIMTFQCVFFLMGLRWS